MLYFLWVLSGMMFLLWIVGVAGVIPVGFGIHLLLVAALSAVTATLIARPHIV
jgi:hypothetical protein